MGKASDWLKHQRDKFRVQSNGSNEPLGSQNFDFLKRSSSAWTLLLVIRQVFHKVKEGL